MRNLNGSSIAIAMFAASACCFHRVASAQPEVDEVVVTTGFRPEALTESVGSTSILDASLIEARQAEHLESVVGATANVTMTSGASRGRFLQIRGIILLPCV